MKRITLKEILSDPEMRQKYRKSLTGNEYDIERQMQRYDDRVELKETLLERGYSNRIAEFALDQRHYPRPAGWHTVFFYPDSYQIRYPFLFWIAIVVITTWFAPSDGYVKYAARIFGEFHWWKVLVGIIAIPFISLIFTWIMWIVVIPMGIAYSAILIIKDKIQNKGTSL